MALPVRVFRMKKRSRTMRRKETPMTVICSLVSRTPADDESRRAGASDGKNFGSGRRRAAPPFSRKSETPIAVIRRVSRAARRTGR